MTYLSADGFEGTELGADSAADAGESPYLAVLENLIGLLADGLDHPEIWQVLAEAAKHADIAELHALIDALRPAQIGAVRKVVDVIGGIVHTLSVDRGEGLTFLTRMAAEHAHCPQLAGAIFFLERTGAGRSADLSGKFCEAPFVKFETLMDGTVAPCCSIWTQQRLGHLDGQTAEQIWNSPNSQAMRASILDGSYRYCNKQRCTFVAEDALPDRDAVTDPALRRVIDEGLTELTQGPRWLFLAHDVTCNLACPSCRSGILAADEAQEARFDKIERQVFRPLLNADGEVLISLSGQGDPWSSPHYRSILRYMADHDLNVRLDLHTNAALMSEKRWEQYLGLERYHPLVNVSIDACTPWVYEVVRKPGKWEKLFPNLEFIAAGRATGIFREFHLNATIQLDNFHEMATLVDLGEQLGADSVRLYMMQNTGDHIAPQFARKNVGDPDHPLHLAFLETLRDARLARPGAHLYDVGHWRARALAARLPSDALGPDYALGALLDAIARSDDQSVRVALCAAGRTRFRDDLRLPIYEAAALHALGFPQQAEYRLREREALGGEAIALN